MNQKLYESYNWFYDDFKVTSQVGGKLRIRGKALYPTVSGNNRKYIEHEIIRSARTLAGKPMDANHAYDIWEDKVRKLGREAAGPPPQFIGHVFDADEEDLFIEYVAEINDPIYVQRFRDSDRVRRGLMNEDEYVNKWEIGPIRGVSVSADYRYHDETCDGDTCQVIPHGIKFKRLSVVEGSETPGVKGAGWEIFETLLENHGDVRIIETLLQDKVSKKLIPKEVLESYDREVVQQMAKKKKKDKQVKETKTKTVKREDVVTVSGDPRAQFLMEQEEAPADTGDHNCAEGEHWSEEQEKCVPNESASEQEDHGCKEGEHWDAEQEKCVPDAAAAEQEEAPTPPCPEGYHEVDGKCVKDAPATAEQEGMCPKGYHNENGECVPDQPPKADLQAPTVEFPSTDKPAPVGVTPAAEIYSLGEPFADYSSFDDCVAKNRGKGDPQAYCASIKRQTEERQLLGEIKQLRKEIAGLKQKEESQALEQKHREATIKETIKELEEQFKTLGFKVESIGRSVAANRLQRDSDTKILKEQFTRLDKWRIEKDGLDKRQCATLGNLKTNIGVVQERYRTLGQIDKKLLGIVNGLNETLSQATQQNGDVHTHLQALETKYAAKLVEHDKKFNMMGDAHKNLVELNRRFKEYEVNNQKTAKETLSTDKTVKELQEKLEKQEGEIATLKTHVKPRFKTAPQSPEQQTSEDEVVTQPYT